MGSFFLALGIPMAVRPADVADSAYANWTPPAAGSCSAAACPGIVDRASITDQLAN
jgi:hypothetical protein